MLAPLMWLRLADHARRVIGCAETPVNRPELGCPQIFEHGNVAAGSGGFGNRTTETFMQACVQQDAVARMPRRHVGLRQAAIEMNGIGQAQMMQEMEE